MKVRIFRERTVTLSTEVEVESIEEANKLLEDMDADEFDEVDSSMETVDKPEWSMIVD